MIRCPDCNGKAIPLKILSTFKIGKDSLIFLETYQPYITKKRTFNARFS